MRQGFTLARRSRRPRIITCMLSLPLHEMCLHNKRVAQRIKRTNKTANVERPDSRLKGMSSFKLKTDSRSKTLMTPFLGAYSPLRNREKEIARIFATRRAKEKKSEEGSENDPVRSVTIARGVNDGQRRRMKGRSATRWKEPCCR